ncbi:MAG TPA: imidazole glycerol phosphate synthase subunit HisH [Methanothermobacter sp.]|nr:imidazole glycerol phosphate synthase subunit HisH [Methanothermobacter sp. MT-2]HHW05233.1 imidazole glycerol phosphate synthase subunit HisH [Methanothermobacter sp.]HOK73422.1 imidazole glycerol phosphate synthase subunit HisH [Methanothermobacter sp.]HOL69702.1 imidazole glycerol phosphate synthase subunit HisH [Methanothermobacter sp.]HPQ05276.1 imidazole glycerol phosphate synthase subunit HisH [Methanothermobacter sp.]
MITIINYGSGNLRSIKNALTKVGGRVEITDDKRQIKKAETILLPGVGAFGKAMKNLKDYKSAIIRHVEDDKPFLGICLGLQLLLTKSEESPNIKGLNIIPGEVLRIPPLGKVPHMGWNQLNMTRNCPILEGAENEYFYFVHSYHAKPKKKDVIVATTDYHMNMVAVLWKDNIFATQFHPEKSGKAGLKILKNFVEFSK